MKLEQAKQHTSNPSIVLKEDFKHGSNFKEKLPNSLKEIDLKTKLLQQEPDQSTRPLQIRQVKFSAQKNKLASDISTLLETSNKMYYFMGRSAVDNFSEIVIYEYMKADGKLEHMELTGIKGVIMAMVAGFCMRRKSVVKKSVDQSKSAKRSQSSKNQRQNLYEIVLLLGTANGYLKTIRFQDPEPNSQPQTSIQNIKLDHTSIIDILILDPHVYSKVNVCLALSMTNRVYLVNFDHMSLLAIFTPTIMTCEVGLSLAVNYERQYFIQACQGGYIIFWDISDKVRNLIRKSASDSQIGIKSSNVKDESDEVSPPQLKSPTFKPSDIHYCISPISIFHAATITGIKFCQLYGNLLLIVTQGGLIKLLALNKSSNAHINQNEYCILIEYQVQHGELISDVKFFPETRDIFVVKNAGLEGVMEKSGKERFVQVMEFTLKNLPKRKDKSTETSFPYKPLCIREIKRSIKPTQRQRSKSVGQSISKCYFQRINFNLELEIERVDRIYPNHLMENIDSVDLVEGRDLIFLRVKDFYLVGQTDLFKTIQLE